MSSKDYYSRIRQFIEIDVWKVKISTLPRTKAAFYQQVRIWIISVAEFKKDKITEKASALTYFSLLSIVPVLAMAFGIAKGFGLENFLVRELRRYFTGNEIIFTQALDWSEKMLETANGGVISGISFVFLIYAVLRLMFNIEMSFNEIWDTKSRSWQRKISDYLAIILLGPVFIILSSSATVFVTAQVQSLAAAGSLPEFIRPFVFLMLKVIPYLIISLLLTILYLIFPNTRVKLGPAIIAGILAGTVFQLTQFAWINGQVYLSKYNAIYGTFAALPLFMIYLQMSWLVVLFGAEYAYATQNANTWEYRHSGMRMSPSHRKKVTLLILRHIVKNFELGNRAFTISELSAIIQIPYRFIRNILNELEEVGLVNKISTEDAEMFQPAIDIHRLDIFTVLRKLDYKGFNELKSNEDSVFEKIESLLSQMEDEVRASSSNKLLTDL